MQYAQIVKKLTGGGTGSLLLGKFHNYAEKQRNSYQQARNPEFSFLMSVGILLVVIGHAKGISLNLFTEWFPIYSFHMPLFFFISGYFYRRSSEEKPWKYISKKIKTLLLPYFIWNLVYGVLVNLLSHCGLIEFGKPLTLYNLFIEPWVLGAQFEFNRAGWFVLTLFLVQVVYLFLSKATAKLPKGQNFLLLTLLLIVGLLTVWYCKNHLVTGIGYVLGKLLFCLPIYHFGVIFHKLEKNLEKRLLVILAILFVVQFVLFKISPNLNVRIWICDFTQGPFFIPYLVSITGILFWVIIAKLLLPVYRNSRWIRYIGQNTWSVMLHHFTAFFLINCIFYLLAIPLDLSGFNIQGFKTGIGYFYLPWGSHFALFYVAAGIAFPLLIKYGVERLILLMDKRLAKNNHYTV